MTTCRTTDRMISTDPTDLIGRDVMRLESDSDTGWELRKITPPLAR